MEIINKIGSYDVEYIDITEEKFDIAQIKCKMKNIKRMFTRMIKKHRLLCCTNNGDPMVKGTNITFVYQNQMVTFGYPMVGNDDEWWCYQDDVIVDIPVIIHK